MKGGPKLGRLSASAGARSPNQLPTGPRRGNSAALQSKRPGGRYRPQAPWDQRNVAKMAVSRLQQKGGRRPPAPAQIHVSAGARDARTSWRKAPWAPGSAAPAARSCRILSTPQHPEHGGEANATRGSRSPWLQLRQPHDHRASWGSRGQCVPTRPQYEAGGRCAPPAHVQKEAPASSLPGSSNAVSGVVVRAGGCEKRINTAFLVPRRQSLTVWQPSYGKAKPGLPVFVALL
ncbi:hypothetical protein NDU88_008495 [Pleurodeles waltl]|uniref:Uncharacterized protein n=1 Tax=Pleurodeles waltl TaxID=8319 RepID=A0AAV7RSJ2_PLEWA|nr:hypothetical protein NDU88_008495 [Pleurodeles waltl]